MAPLLLSRQRQSTTCRRGVLRGLLICDSSHLTFALLLLRNEGKGIGGPQRKDVSTSMSAAWDNARILRKKGVAQMSQYISAQLRVFHGWRELFERFSD